MSDYIGSELELFAHARNWKAYWGSRLQPLVRGHVLDVGAGLGANIDVLANPTIQRWHALEPDDSLAAQISTHRDFEIIVQVGTLQDIDSTTFDTVLYIDVLEHIQDDSSELDLAAGLLAPGGNLIVLAPAHNQLFSPFDKAIGHFRRYNREMLEALSPSGLQLTRIEYLDSVGMAASFANRLLLRQTEPSARQIQTWDRVMVPCSRVLDTVTQYHLGKTIIAAWQRVT